jgi:hypothetical protein
MTVMLLLDERAMTGVAEHSALTTNCHDDGALQPSDTSTCRRTRDGQSR